MFDFQKINLKKEIKNLEKLSVKERGVGIKFLKDYLKEQRGEKGLKRVEEELKKNNYKLIDIDKIDDMDWILSKITIIYFLAVAKVFNLKKQDAVSLGEDVVLSTSTLAKVFIKYFLSTESTIKRAASTWRNFYSKGRVVVKEINKKKKFVILQLKNVNRHPAVCAYDEGVFVKIVEIATGWKDIKVEETKCFFEGDQYHEFIISGK